MSKTISLLSAISGTTVIIGGGGYLISLQKPPLIKDSFKHALIKLDSTEEELLKTKLSKIKQGTINSGNKKLLSVQKKEKTKDNDGLNELKEACKEIYDSSFDNKEDKIFKDFQSYCARTNKDKFEKDKWEIETNWTDKQKSLKSKEPLLVSELIKISEAKSTDGKELKDWCESSGELIFEGENDETFKNIKEFCIKAK